MLGHFSTSTEMKLKNCGSDKPSLALDESGVYMCTNGQLGFDKGIFYNHIQSGASQVRLASLTVQILEVLR